MPNTPYFDEYTRRKSLGIPLSVNTNLPLTVYVSPNGNDKNSGLLEADPVRTISAALCAAARYNSKNIRLSAGEFTSDKTLRVSPGMTISGSSEGCWS